jgi:predicted phosphodiesterase
MFEIQLNYKKIIFAGDIHGLINLKSVCLNYIKHIDNSLIIFCGDIGLGFSPFIIEKNILLDCNIILKEKNIHIILFRGNHDNPDLFKENNNYNLSNITVIPDYTILKTELYNILCIGGGISIDRSLRNNMTYWNNEIITPLNDDIKSEIKNLNYNIDIICTHESPTFIKPINESIIEQGDMVHYYSITDKQLKQDNWNDRIKLNDIYEFIIQYHNIKYWVYGHFHEHYYTEYNNIKFIGLDMFYAYCKSINNYLYKLGIDFYDLDNPDSFSYIFSKSKK